GGVKFRGNLGGIVRARFSPDGETLIAYSTPGPLHRWKVATGKEVPLLPGDRMLNADVTATAFLPNSSILFCGVNRSKDKGVGAVVMQYDLDGRKASSWCRDHAGLTSLALSENGRSLALYRTDGKCIVWDLERGKHVVEEFLGSPGPRQGSARF